MLCKRCQTELPPGERFCPTCGSLQPMICPNCGSESRPGSRTCSNCGKKLPVLERENKLVYTRRVKRPTELIATAAITIGALMILGGAIFFLSQSVDFGHKKPVQVSGEVQQEEQLQVPEEVPEEVPLDVVVPEEPETPDEPLPEEELPAEEIPEDEQPTEEETPAEEETPSEEEQPAEEETPVEDAYVDSQWIFPDSNERLLTDADIAGLSSWELKVARNEIYARHGRRFNSAELQNHFNSCDWYNGTVAPGDFTDSMLSATELANVQFLKAAE